MNSASTELRWALAAVFLFFGLAVVVGNLSSTGLDALLLAEAGGGASGVSLVNNWFVGGALFTFLGTLFGAWAYSASPQQSVASYADQMRGYDTALLGVGFALVLLGMINFVALAGFATIGELKAILNADEDGGIRGMMRMLLMPGFAVLGSLFFVAGALRLKREKLQKKSQPADPADPNAGGTVGHEIRFNALRFWGGLWYRMGEAVLFALVFFLAISSEYIKIEAANRVWILLLALLLGMFVKPAEQLVNGLALRIFEGIKAMLK